MFVDNTHYRLGLDVGSTTAKLALLGIDSNIVFKAYERHNIKIYETVINLLEKILKELGNIRLSIKITGSAGIGIVERNNIQFVQEVIAASNVINKNYPKVRTLIDIGGEDSKLIFFEPNKIPDIRMNGSCAGGTGAFIDQMATLMNVPLEEFSDLAKTKTRIYPIASRCGVFAKTDVQNLVAGKIPTADIAASIFHAVYTQTLNTLARGFDIKPGVMFCGGPFTFLPELKNCFVKNLNLKPDEIVTPEYPELLPAIGTAICEEQASQVYNLTDLIEKIKTNAADTSIKVENRLEPLFDNTAEKDQWMAQKVNSVIPRQEIHNYTGSDCYVGIDSGSTTTKIIVLTPEKKILYSYYSVNKGNPIETVAHGLSEFYKQQIQAGKKLNIRCAASTGYGEDLIKATLNCDFGLVETIAHYKAALYFNPKVSFIMDIGGQDMKAIFVENGIINRIELNESCSSGCGSFIATFGNTLGYTVSEFAVNACNSYAPCDLGTRCTVFMNSKVKQALRENATSDDISAGLAISVIRNALYKVLKLTDYKELGEHIVVQGGTFRNPAVHRALEKLTGKKVICSDIPELMGAFGAALQAIDYHKKNKQKTIFIDLDKLSLLNNFSAKQINCKGCENNCYVTKFTFSNGENYYSGNKCEKIFTNKGERKTQGENIFELKTKLLFEEPTIKPNKPLLKIGIPRILNFYENYTFWRVLFSNSNIEIVLSEPSTFKLYETGAGTVMSDSICFPAKLVHGHIMSLVKNKVDRIFYPFVVYENTVFKDEENSFNCPIVSSYSDVIKSAMNPMEKYGIDIDSPVINFGDNDLLQKACVKYLQTLGVNKSTAKQAFAKATSAYIDYKNQLQQAGEKIIDKARQSKTPTIVLAGRPYHTDNLINHKIPDMLQDMGINVISEDVLPYKIEKNDIQTVTQWSYPNRIYNAALFVANEPENIQFVQLNSFGCGPDAIVIDECSEILKSKGKIHTLIRVDEITSTGSVRLRLRSLIDSLAISANERNNSQTERQQTAIFGKADRERTILAPFFAEMYSPFLPALFELVGYKLINLPPPDNTSVKLGLKYTNNEICYPATIVIGDVIKALQSGKYNESEIAIGITQTGGQCRASSYISLIKKAMIKAGFGHIPVISVNAGNTNNEQSGFQPQWGKYLKTIFSTVLFSDMLAQLYYRTIAHTDAKYKAKLLHEKYIKLCNKHIVADNYKEIFGLLTDAVNEYNQIPKDLSSKPQIGLVGEIYVKYNSFGHQHIVNWLIEQGIEVVIPPIMDFFIQELVNIKVNQENFLIKSKIKTNLVLFLMEQKIDSFINKANKIMQKFELYSPTVKIKEMAEKASNILQLTNQFGEGWLIPAEIAEFAEKGINNVVSVQPFGCIANHVVSKGVEKRIKDLYPKMNLLFLDFDDGTSPVNILNRLFFMAKNVKG